LLKKHGFCVNIWVKKKELKLHLSVKNPPQKTQIFPVDKNTNKNKKCNLRFPVAPGASKYCYQPEGDKPKSFDCQALKREHQLPKDHLEPQGRVLSSPVGAQGPCNLFFVYPPLVVDTPPPVDDAFALSTTGEV
jgi:hypothetical protein